MCEGGVYIWSATQLVRSSTALARAEYAQLRDTRL